MKKVFTYIISLLLASAANNLFAQSTSPGVKEIYSPQAKANIVLAKITVACQPAEHQASKINFVYANYFRKFEEYHTNPQGTGQSLETRLRMLKDNLHEKIQSILTPEQMCEWTAYQQNEGLDE